MAKTFDQIISEMVTFVTTALGQTVDTRTGTVMREAILAPTADQLEDAYTRTDEVETNQSVNNYSSMTDSAMDALAANFGISRLGATPASGTIRFYRFQQPTTPILIPAGTEVSTVGSGDQITFATLSATTLDGTSEQDTVSGAYYVDVQAAATTTGTLSNIAANTIRAHTVPGIDEVTNQADFSGGRNEQTNEELSETIIAASQGNLGTRSGYDTLVRSNFTVDDVAVIGPTDPEAKRAQFGGAVDVTFLSDSFIQSEETVLESVSTMTPTFLPLIGVTEIIGIEQGTLLEKTLVLDTDYTIYFDTAGHSSRSQEESSRIDFSVSTFTPDPGSVFTIRYTNSELARIIQAFLLTEANLIIGSDPLVKISDTIQADITADVTIVPGFSSVTVQADVENALSTFFSGLLLDEDVQSSDVITEIGNVDGVDSVDLGTFTMFNVRTATNVSEVLAGKDQDVKLRNTTITVVG